ncbi:MAG: class I SAM-dependent methyltransferase [Gammaproteobacteria bacterium]|nr:class I SAM-dependent methyltransferase [Gammaproteobacteria bacterium]
METLISHGTNESFDSIMQKTALRIKQEGDKPYISVQGELELLEQLAEFDFGRFLLTHRGINGYWTHYMLTHPWTGRKTGKNNQGKDFSECESFLLNRAPTMQATQQRFEIFLRENQKAVKESAKLACIPSGLMGELLYLNYDNIQHIDLIGIDCDPDTLKDAADLAEQKALSMFTQFIRADAWHLNHKDEFDLISSNGLNIYEANDETVTELYRSFYDAQKPGGKLVTSFLTPPPVMTDECEWDMSQINQHDLLLQKIIFVDILDARWQCYRSTEQTRAQLTSVGYTNIEFIYDKARMFPTVVAYKR